MQYQQYYPLVFAFLLACVMIGLWIRDMRVKVAALNAATKPTGTIGEVNIFKLAKPYLEQMPTRDSFPLGTLAVRSARSYRNGEYHTEFYGDFMRLYRVSEDEIVEDRFLMFHWLPKILLAEYSVAELYEHIGMGWIADNTWQQLCDGVVNGGC